MKVLRQEREARGWSRAALARDSRLNESVYSLIERGRYTPYPVQLERIAQALAWSEDPEQLLKEVDGESS